MSGAGRRQLHRLRGADARSEPAIHQVLVAPVVDRLTRHPQLICDLSDRTARLNQIQHLATELRGITPSHDDLLRVDMPEIQLSPPRDTRGTPDADQRNSPELISDIPHPGVVGL